MSKRNHSLFTALLILASLAGQVSAAVTLPCDLLGEAAHAATVDSMPPGHHGMAMGSAPEADGEGAVLDDCCADGVCTLSHCASYPPVGVDSPGLEALHAGFWFASMSGASYFGPPSLERYRPPISA